MSATTYVLRDLSDAVTVATTLTHSWFRGHTRTVNELVPKIFRESFLGTDVVEFRKEYELLKIEEFKRQAPVLSAHPVPSNDRRLEWLILMQHYGMPTRLLDWTENALVALYFAVSGDIDEDGELWAMLPWALNRESIGIWGLPVVQESAATRYLVEQPYWNGESHELAKELDLGNPIRSACGIEPAMMFPRMAVQESTFTIHPSPQDAVSIQTVLGDPKHLVRYVVPAASKHQLKMDLHHLGYCRRRLFPDLDGLSQTLNPGWFEIAYAPPDPPRCGGEA